MAWTNVTKPTSTSYTKINGTGREVYDQPDITYDDSDIFFDGLNPNMWTNLAKPTITASTSMLSGIANGLLMPLTRSSVVTIAGNDPWTKVPKAT